MNKEVVIDTNVPVVANGRSAQASHKCVLACIDTLLRVREFCCVLLDNGGLILEEYREQLSPSGQPGLGDGFFKWLWNNQGNSGYCRRVEITRDAERDFVEFPEDPELERFDRSDRKFVAVVRTAAGDARVVNATDSDWWHYELALERNGVRVENVCPDLMRRARHGRHES